MTLQSTPFVRCLVGFTGVGKLTIAQTLAQLTEAQVVDNHWINDPILRLVTHDSAAPVPEAVWPLVARVRGAVLESDRDGRPSYAKLHFHIRRGKVTVGTAESSWTRRRLFVTCGASPFWAPICRAL
jgi:hypothetical protein